MLGRMARPRLFLLPMLALLACDSAPASALPKPPPLPPFPSTSTKPADEPAATLPVEPAAPAVEARGSAREQHKDHEAPPTRQQPAHAAKQARGDEPSKEKPSTREQTKVAPAMKPKASQPAPVKAASPSPTAAAQPAPIVATTPKPEVASKVSVPKTVHLAIDLPSGLQADLNHDPRMQPWVNQVVATIDRCYASESKSNANLAGTIEVLVTMHENERPDADIKQLPPALSPIVACATGGLMRTKMPLFTGKEGTRYPVKIRFSH
jgi:hypothetical protein